MLAEINHWKRQLSASKVAHARALLEHKGRSACLKGPCMLRVIFDRSAFHHGERFNLLATSQLRALCYNRKLSVTHTPIFLEETLRMYGNQQRRAQLRQQLPFILAICNGGIYQDERTIWKRELALNHGPHTHIFVSKGNQKRYVQSIRTGILQDDWNMWRPSLWEDMEKKKQRQHDAFKRV
jgi:hypothetical protein